MKKAIYTIGATTAVVFFCGIILFILGEWGALVEYHASEWRGIQFEGASPLTRATLNISFRLLGIGFLTGIIALILLFITTTKKARKAHNKHLEQNKTPLAEGQNQIDS
ncbi:hypothetical protein E4P28_08635 [Rothia dentocariosa]|uniref:hypothetical protein n=1 Tax=Rothia dentocariosa TaxID=2047 RepID=UPI001072E317|nr:hypothetical protein [Rothia dentocariosa]TFI33588.1 hypothetical protein E4P28_08635 [Rothia dentocariosa]